MPGTKIPIPDGGAMTQDRVIEISNVWKIFGARPEAALAAIRERGLTKAEVLAEFNAVVGVADLAVGVPGEAPVRSNLSIGDTIAGIHAALGVVMALYAQKAGNAATGQVVDVALYESMFNLLEAVIPEFSGAGVVRQPSGTTVTGIVPTNTYLCADNKYVVIGGNGDSIYKRLMETAGYPQLANDPRMADNAGRVKHEKELDEAIGAWTGALAANEVLEVLGAAEVPSGPIYSVVDMLADPHFNARGLFEEVQVIGQNVR